MTGDPAQRDAAQRDAERLEREPPGLPLLSAAPLLLLLPVVMVAATLTPWLVVTATVAAAAAYRRPDSTRCMVALGIGAAVWVLARPDWTSAWNLVVAILLLTSHSVLALRATVPPAAELGRAIRWRWLIRAGVVAAITAVVWLATVGAEHLPRSTAAGAVAVGLLLVAALTLLLRLETVRHAGGAAR